MENHAKKYQLVVKRKRVPVTKKVYKAYYQEKEHEKYLIKLSKQNDISFEECEESGIQVDYHAVRSTESPEEAFIHKETLQRMRIAVKSLPDQEQWLIVELFYKGKKIRELSAETGIPTMTLYNRKEIILGKLLKMIKK